MHKDPRQSTNSSLIEQLSKLFSNNEITDESFHLIERWKKLPLDTWMASLEDNEITYLLEKHARFTANELRLSLKEIITFIHPNHSWQKALDALHENKKALFSEADGLCLDKSTAVKIAKARTGGENLKTLIQTWKFLALDKEGEGLGLGLDNVIKISQFRNGHHVLNALHKNGKFLLSSDGLDLNKNQVLKVATKFICGYYIRFLCKNSKKLLPLKNIIQHWINATEIKKSLVKEHIDELTSWINENHESSVESEREPIDYSEPQQFDDELSRNSLTEYNTDPMLVDDMGQPSGEASLYSGLVAPNITGFTSVENELQPLGDATFHSKLLAHASLEEDEINYLLGNYEKLTGELGLDHNEIIEITNSPAWKTQRQQSLEALLEYKDALFSATDGMRLSKENAVKIAKLRKGASTLKVLAEKWKFLALDKEGEGLGLGCDKVIEIATYRGSASVLKRLYKNGQHLLSSEGLGLSKDQVVKIAARYDGGSYISFLCDNLVKLLPFKRDIGNWIDTCSLKTTPSVAKHIATLTSLINENEKNNTSTQPPEDIGCSEPQQFGDELLPNSPTQDNTDLMLADDMQQPWDDSLITDLLPQNTTDLMLIDDMGQPSGEASLYSGLVAPNITGFTPVESEPQPLGDAFLDSLFAPTITSWGPLNHAPSDNHLPPAQNPTWPTPGENDTQQFNNELLDQNHTDMAPTDDTHQPSGEASPYSGLVAPNTTGLTPDEPQPLSDAFLDSLLASTITSWVPLNHTPSDNYLPPAQNPTWPTPGENDTQQFNNELLDQNHTDMAPTDDTHQPSGEASPYSGLVARNTTGLTPDEPQPLDVATFHSELLAYPSLEEDEINYLLDNYEQLTTGKLRLSDDEIIQIIGSSAWKRQKQKSLEALLKYKDTLFAVRDGGVGLSKKDAITIAKLRAGAFTLEVLAEKWKFLALDKEGEGLGLGCDKVIEIATYRGSGSVLKKLYENGQHLLSSEGLGLSKDQVVKIAARNDGGSYIDFLCYSLITLDDMPASFPY